MLSGSMHTISTKPKLEGCVNFSSNTPHLGESPQSSGEVISSPRSPDYPPRVSVSPHPRSPTFSMTPVNSTVIMDTAKYNEESTKNVTTLVDKVIEYALCPSPVKTDDLQVDIVKTESDEQENTSREKETTDSEMKTELFDIKKDLQTVKSEWPEDGCSTTADGDVATASQEKSANSSFSTPSKAYSSSKEKHSKEDRRYCSRCRKRKGIKRASIGVQCKRDRHVLSSLSGKPLSYSKSTTENLRLNLQMKNYKMLDNPSVKAELLEGLKYRKFIHIEWYPNGGATVVHMYQDEINNLSREQMEELAQEYFKVSTRINLAIR